MRDNYIRKVQREGSVVAMNVDTFEKREQMLKFRVKVLQAEQERIEDAETMRVLEARKQLRERVKVIYCPDVRK